MEHFVAYHSVKKMGYVFKATEDLHFLSKKISFLKKAIGNTVWVVQGIHEGKKTAYTLCGAYIADGVDTKDSNSDVYVITGHRVKEFSPPIQLNGLSWFSLLLNSQNNFSFGFNRINDEKVIQSLVAIQDNSNQTTLITLPDIDLSLSVTEGSTHLMSHLRRERNRTIVEAKKAATLNATGRLCCEACDFDFLDTYGSLGNGFCEVHHRVPLSGSSCSATTTLDDLAILCSNCHRIIHRSVPMLTVAQLSEVVRKGRK